DVGGTDEEIQFWRPSINTLRTTSGFLSLLYGSTGTRSQFTERQEHGNNIKKTCPNLPYNGFVGTWKKPPCDITGRRLHISMHHIGHTNHLIHFTVQAVLCDSRTSGQIVSVSGCCLGWDRVAETSLS
ncbi:hypothetical protein AB205_0111060, partial [Aquarana catesbeiana]